MKTLFRNFFLTLAAIAWTGTAAPVHAQSTGGNPEPNLGALFQEVGFEQKLGASIPAQLQFRDEAGKDVALGDYWDKPTLLVLAYYGCPALCTQVIDGLTESLRQVAFDPGKEFHVVIVSIDPSETPALAAQKKAGTLAKYRREDSAAGWHFLSGAEPEIRRLASAVGFRYAYEPRSKQYIHPSGIVVLAPGGKISQYFLGVRYPFRELRLSLVAASDRKIGSLVDSILLFCYHYDPAASPYGNFIQALIRVAGLVSVLALGGLLFFLFRRGKEKKSLELSAFVFPLLPPSASTVSGKVDWLMGALLAISLLVLGGIFFTIVYFAIKYRKGSRADRSRPITNPRKYEITWTLIPLLIFMVLFFWGARLFYTMNVSPSDAATVYVVGKQWMWKFQHWNGRREIGELHVPVGRPIRLLMISEDVIHSVFIPAFRVKHDVLPGRYVTTWFEAAKPGRYHLFCTQYCGTDHARMTGSIVAMPTGDYERWLSGKIPAAENDPFSVGRELFRSLGCASCHGAKGEGLPGAPPLQGLYGRRVTLQGGGSVLADENYLRESILDPEAKIPSGFQALMPSFRGRLDEEQILALLNYLQSLQGPKK